MKFLTWLGAMSGKKRISISPAVVCSSATLSVFAIFRLSFFVGAGFFAANVSWAGRPAMQTIVSAVEMILIKLQSSFVAERECYYEEDCRLLSAIGKGSVLAPNRFGGAPLRAL